jgi:rhodanese-related sulfurtransferase/rubrerythrin
MFISSSATHVAELTAEQLRKTLTSQSEDTYLLIDVRQPEEYQAGHIPGAKLLPLSQFEDRLEEVWRNRDRMVIFYCQHGSRSRLAAQLTVAGLELAHVYQLRGGFSAWQGEALHGFPRLRTFPPSQSVTAVLLRALDLEKGGHCLYAALGLRFRNTTLRALLDELGSAEVIHARLLHSRLQDHSPEPVEDFESMFERLPGELLESGRSWDELTARAHAAGVQGRVAVLELALELEYQAYDLYKNLADRATSWEEREVFTDLADQEKGHAQALLRKLASLATTAAQT